MKTERYLLCVLSVIMAWRVLPQSVPSAYANETPVAAPIALVGDHQETRGDEEPDKSCASKPKDRAESVSAILSHLGLGEGATVADIGAGSGNDTWVFAKIVGEAGTVFAQEIVEGNVKTLERQAREKRLIQVRAMLGCSDDPCLPSGSTDLAFLHHVYHHFAKPRQMLRGIWRALKPRGYLVVVDQRRGTLQDWAPREQREQKHFWIAETTVVREAREEGFAFTGCAEDCWHTDKDFVLVFQRPAGSENPDGDPDRFEPLSVRNCSPMFLPLSRPYDRPVFVALGEGRKLIAPILRHSSGKGLEIVLEEWATQKDERPPLAAGLTLPSVLTDNGVPELGPEPVDVVFFLDSYHLLFHGRTLLAKIHESLMPTGCVYILDRQADRPLSRRQASHFRMIEPQTVEREMSEAGFHLWFRGPRAASDRFLLVFGKTRSEDMSPENDPFLGGPEIPQKPGRWLKSNYWRLRHLKADDGSVLHIKSAGPNVSIEKVSSPGPEKETWRIVDGNLMLHFEKKDNVYLLTQGRCVEGNCRSGD
jgi:predicted methyltransferase